MEAVSATFARHGYALTETRTAAADDLAAMSSTWARRLLANPRPNRQPLFLRLERGSGTMTRDRGSSG